MIGNIELKERYLSLVKAGLILSTIAVIAYEKIPCYHEGDDIVKLACIQG